MPDDMRGAPVTRNIGPILVILLDPGAEAEARLALLRAMHPGAKLMLLTEREYAARFEGLVDEVWDEGVARGPSRFLALVRRISWMSFAHVHDLDGSSMTRILRLFVWPRPRWHAFRP